MANTSSVAPVSGIQPFKPARQIGIGGLELGPRERLYLQQVIDSNRLSHGSFSKRFEELFAQVHHSRFAIFCSSGTAALQVALAALKELCGWKDGDEVILPATTFVSTINIVLHNRLTPVLVDVDAATFNIDPGLVESRIGPRTRAMLPVHLLGLPCNMSALAEIAKHRHLKIIEDSCETMFATCGGRSVGSWGEAGCFSTYLAHFIAAGIGGLITTSDAELLGVMRSLINHGRDTAYLSIDDDQGVSRQALHAIVAKRFSFVRLGYNFRATEFEAAIGLAQLEQRQAIIRGRQENAAYFIDQLKHLDEPIQLPVIPSDREHMFMLFPIVLRRQPKQALVNFLEERLIETRDFFPVVTQSLYQRQLHISPGDFPVAYHLAQHGFLIGCHQYLKPEERQYIVETIRAFFRGASGHASCEDP